MSSSRPHKRAKISEGPSNNDLVQNVDGNKVPKNDLVQKNLDEYKVHDMPGADVYHLPAFIEKTIAAEWYEELRSLDSWYQPQLKMYGRTMAQSRKIAAYATDPNLTLKYSGQVVDMHYSYPDVLRQIQDLVEERLGVSFNHVLLNNYEDGSVYIGNHRDHVENKVIASLSLGAPRTFNMTYAPLKPKSPKPCKTHDAEAPNLSKKKPSSQEKPSSQGVKAKNPVSIKKSWVLESGSLVVMQGDTQRNWKHEIPKQLNVKEGRISLTFRQLNQ